MHVALTMPPRYALVFCICVARYIRVARPWTIDVRAHDKRSAKDVGCALPLHGRSLPRTAPRTDLRHDQHQSGDNQTMVIFTCRRKTIQAAKCCQCDKDATQTCSFPLRGSKAGKTCGRNLCGACALRGALMCTPHVNLTRKEAETARIAEERRVSASLTPFWKRGKR